MSAKERIIIALHGAGMQASVWDLLAKELPHKALSFPKPLPASIEDMAGWVETQLETYSPASVVLMGHSMGALVALEAARHPAVAALVLVGAAAQMPVHPDLLKQAVDAPDAAAGLVIKWGISPAHPEAADILKKHMCPETFAAGLSACNAYQHGAAAAKGIHQPVLVLSGADDKLAKPSDGKALAETFKNGRFILGAGSGHMLMVEDPVEMSGKISAFIAALYS